MTLPLEPKGETLYFHPGCERKAHYGRLLRRLVLIDEDSFTDMEREWVDEVLKPSLVEGGFIIAFSLRHDRVEKHIKLVSYEKL